MTLAPKLTQLQMQSIISAMGVMQEAVTLAFQTAVNEAETEARAAQEAAAKKAKAAEPKPEPEPEIKTKKKGQF